jgi:hypothetical protein
MTIEEYIKLIKRINDSEKKKKILIIKIDYYLNNKKEIDNLLFKYKTDYLITNYLTYTNYLVSENTLSIW